jgi:hypothetical protein
MKARNILALLFSVSLIYFASELLQLERQRLQEQSDAIVVFTNSEEQQKFNFLPVDPKDKGNGATKDPTDPKPNEPKTDPTLAPKPTPQGPATIGEVPWRTDSFTINIIPHSHQDFGWLYTAQEYFKAQVSEILDNVVEKMASDSFYRFVIADLAFLKLWWNKSSAASQQALLRAIKSKQIEVLNGGLVLNDQASPGYEHILLNFEAGMDFLTNDMQVPPELIRTGWSIDQFGLSSTMTKLYSGMGMHQAVINRISTATLIDKTKRNALLFNWDANSMNLPPMPTLELHSGYNYRSQFSVYYGNYRAALKPPVPFLSMNPIITECATLVDELNSYHQFRWQSTKATNSTVSYEMFGDDFTFTKVSGGFTNLDTIMILINSNPQRFKKTNFRYSTVQELMSQIKKPEPMELVKETDFLPFIEDRSQTAPEVAWIGYFTTRAFLKKEVRNTFELSRNIKDFFVVQQLRNNKELGHEFLAIMKEKLDWVSSTFLHHDTITGTSREKVVQDFLLTKTNLFHDQAKLLCEVFGGSVKQLFDQEYALKLQETNYTGFASHSESRLNLQILMGEARSVVFTILNNSPNTLQEFELKTTSSDYKFMITDEYQMPVPVLSIVCTENTILGCLIRVRVKVEPYARRMYVVTPNTSSFSYPVLIYEKGDLATSKKVQNKERTIAWNFEIIQGQLSITKTDQLGDTTAQLGVACYSPEPPQSSSGVYISKFVREADSIEIKGFIIKEDDEFLNLLFKANDMLVHLTLDKLSLDKVQVKYIKPPNSEYVERELVVRYSSGLKNNRVIHTDSNGLEFRKREFRELERKNKLRTSSEFWNIETNSYPVSEAVFLQEEEQPEEKRRQMLVRVDRGERASGQTEGTIELSIWRRTIADDARGMPEAAMESETVFVNHQLYLGAKAVAAARKEQALESKPIVHYVMLDEASPSRANNFKKTAEALQVSPRPSNLSVSMDIHNKDFYRIRLANLSDKEVLLVDLERYVAQYVSPGNYHFKEMSLNFAEFRTSLTVPPLTVNGFQPPKIDDFKDDQVEIQPLEVRAFIFKRV